MLKSYKELRVWQTAMSLVRRIYLLTERFPESERFGLRAQMTRAAVSIPSNIAEGYGRNSRKDYIRFLYQSQGSLYELDTQMQIAQGLGFVDSDDEAAASISDLAKMLNRMIS